MFAVLTCEIAAQGQRQRDIAERLFTILQTRHDQNVFTPGSAPTGCA